MTFGGFFTLALQKAHCLSPSTSSQIFEEIAIMDSPLIPSPSHHHCCSYKCVLSATALVLGGAAVGYAIGSFIVQRKVRVNCLQKMDCEKIVDTVDVEDIGDKKAFCRCWHSAKFPYCDGSHAKHNKETGDNVGPLVVTNESK